MCPIRGMTDVITPRLPALGKLRKGGAQVEKNGKKTVGPDLQYFRFTSERADVLAAFRAVYGERPVALHVYLPYLTVNENFATWKEKWVAGGLEHRCDGETCTIWLTPEGKYSQEPKPCPGKCDEVGRLSLILPDLVRAGFVGLVTLETHSINDILNVSACLAAVSEARGGNPLGLRGVEFVLRRKPETISTPGWGDDKGKRQRVEKWLVSIEPVPTWAETALLLASEQAAELPEPALEPNEPDADEGEIAEQDAEPPEPSAIDAEAVVARLGKSAKAEDAKTPGAKLSDNNRATAWQALKALPLTDNALIEVVRRIYGKADFETRGQAAAVYHWVNDDKDAATREALAIATMNAGERAAEEEFDGLAD